MKNHLLSHNLSLFQQLNRVGFKLLKVGLVRINHLLLFEHTYRVRSHSVQPVQRKRFWNQPKRMNRSLQCETSVQKRFELCKRVVRESLYQAQALDLFLGTEDNII